MNPLMNMTTTLAGIDGYDLWVFAASALAACSCALLGNFLLLRKMSMMGDAISHAVLPGLAAAFLITGSRDTTTMLAGAAIVGVMTALLTEWIHKLGKVEQSASMGVVFTTLFAIGLIMIVRAADHVDLDASCVLYGQVEAIPMTTPPDATGWEAIPPAVLTLGVMFLVNLLATGLFFKELKISSFDPALATTLGINATVMHYLLMTLVAATTVAAFEAVGSILVIAMLIVPAATARLLTDRLAGMIGLSMVIAIFAAAAGQWGASGVPAMLGYPETNVAPMIAVMLGVAFVIAMIASPRQGIISRMMRQIELSLRITREDVLGLLYRLQEVRPGASAPRQLIRDAIQSRDFILRRAIKTLVSGRLIESGPGGWRLTDAGRQRAGGLLRAHRLWESYLAHHLNLPVDHLHAPAENLEHITDPSMMEELSQGTGGPPTDPMGRRIPPG